jgi:hypothetical protein
VDDQTALLGDEEGAIQDVQGSGTLLKNLFFLVDCYFPF